MSYNAELCRATRRMRTRLAEAVERIDALEAELRSERAAIAAERAALTAQMESPEAARDVMELAQVEIQSAVMEALTSRHPRGLCKSCGGLGHGMTKGLMGDRIAAFCAAHDLPPAPPADCVDWPTVPGRYVRDNRWLEPPASKRCQAARSPVW
jgi:hypothetical protein